jgi:hypothetical protein
VNLLKPVVGQKNQEVLNFRESEIRFVGNNNSLVPKLIFADSAQCSPTKDMSKVCIRQVQGNNQIEVVNQKTSDWIQIQATAPNKTSEVRFFWAKWFAQQTVIR